jgi:colicin import membrane protein
MPHTASPSGLPAALKKSLGLHLAVLGLVVVLPYLHKPPEVKPPPVIEAVLVAPQKINKPEKPQPVAKAPPPAEPLIETPPEPVLEKPIIPKPETIKPEPVKELPKVALPAAKPEPVKPAKPPPEKVAPAQTAKPTPIIKKPTLNTRAFDEEMKNLQKESINAELKAEAEKATAHARDAANLAIRDKYQRLINQRVVTKWNRPPTARNGMVTTLRITVLPGGEVGSVITIQSSGNPAFDASAEEAVRRASPLPVPSDPTIFRQYFSSITFRFNPEDLQ